MECIRCFLNGSNWKLAWPIVFINRYKTNISLNLQNGLHMISIILKKYLQTISVYCTNDYMPNFVNSFNVYKGSNLFFRKQCNISVFHWQLQTKTRVRNVLSVWSKHRQIKTLCHLTSIILKKFLQTISVYCTIDYMPNFVNSFNVYKGSNIFFSENSVTSAFFHRQLQTKRRVRNVFECVI